MDSIEEKSYSRLEWFFYIIFLPFLFTAVLSGIILSAMNVDVVEGLKRIGNQIPFVEKYVPDPKSEAEQNAVQDTKDTSQDEQAEYEKIIAEKDVQIEELQKELLEREKQVAKLEQEVEQLKVQTVEKAAADEEHAEKIKELAKLYSSMSASKAAPILGNLGIHEAVMILSQMDQRRTAEILAKMEAKKAADLSILLKDTSKSRDAEIKAYQERIDELIRQLDEAKREADKEQKLIKDPKLADTVRSFEVMDAKSAADILSKMWEKGEKQKVSSIVKAMDETIRSNILAEMEADIAALITPTLLN